MAVDEPAEPVSAYIADMGALANDPNEAQRKRNLTESCAKYNALLTWTRFERGPQWDYTSANYHVARNSPEYFAGVERLPAQEETNNNIEQ